MPHQPSRVSTYDDVPYPSGPFHLTHPCHLATVARLFGLEPPPVTGCRALELGCASGGNLIPMAVDFPASDFVGIDLSARQIADGNRFLEELAARNVRLQHCSIMDVDESYGKFDYILCHGVYSWVPREVQDRILQLGRDLLTPHGIMYVSYNTFPGWYLRGVVRDMMRYHAAAFEKPADKICQSRALLKFLVDSASTHSEAYRQLLRDEAKVLERQTDSYLFHEHLEEVNEPLYFHEFVERAEQVGLRYLGDANFASMLAEQFREETATILRDTPLLRQEQYMDFLTARTFRMTLLCHQELTPDRNVTPARLLCLQIRLNERLEEIAGGEHAATDREVRFRNPQHSIATANGLVQSAIRKLNQTWPSFISVRELLDDPQTTPDSILSADDAVLLDDLMTFLTRGIVELQVDPPSIALQAGPRPLCSLLARRMAELGRIVTNRAHRSVAIDDLGRFVLVCLDGAHDRAWLIEQLREAIERGEFEVRHEGGLLQSADPTLCGEILDHVLQGLAERSLLLQS